MQFNPAAPQNIVLNGSKGVFKIPDGKIKVHFLQTIASPHRSDGHASFLNDLRPLREHIRLDEIRSLDEVLQRDVSDARVGKGLVRYLLESGIDLPAFFPSVIVILVPKENLHSDDDFYPKPPSDSLGEVIKTEESNGFRTKFGEYWSVLDYKGSNGDSIPISELSYNPNVVVPLVIDGQHRTTGFKFISNLLDFRAENAVYRPFYRHYESKIPQDYKADLPVTILWFEADSKSSFKVDAKRYARNLFVNINQSSQSIAKSRKLLLTEDKPTAFLTRQFYDIIAERASFEPIRDLSLFHAGFDFPRTLGKNSEWNPTSIFIPEIVEFSLDQLLFKPTQSIRNVKLNSTDPSKLSTSKFDNLFGNAMFSRYFTKPPAITEEKEEYVITDGDNGETREQLAERFNSLIGFRLYDWINNNGIYKWIFEACAEIDEEIHGPTPRQEFDTPHALLTWEKIFCGAEGLYYDIQDTSTSAVRDYKTAVSSVTSVFYSLLTLKVNSTIEAVQTTHKTLNTVANFSGYILAYDYLINKNSLNDHDYIISKLNEVDWAGCFSFIFFLKHSQYSLSYIKAIDPKSALSFRNIYLRYMYPVFKNSFVYDNPVEDCLESQLFKIEIESKLRAYKSAKGISDNLSSIMQDVHSRQFDIVDESDFNQMELQCIESISRIFELSELDMVDDYTKVLL